MILQHLAVWWYGSPGARADAYWRKLKRQLSPVTPRQRRKLKRLYDEAGMCIVCGGYLLNNQSAGHVIQTGEDNYGRS